MANQPFNPPAASKKDRAIKRTESTDKTNRVRATTRADMVKRSKSPWNTGKSVDELVRKARLTKKPQERAKAPRGKKLTIAENVRMDEPKVTGNNVGFKIKFRNQ